MSWQECTQMPTQTPSSSNPTSTATSNPLLQSNAPWPFGTLFLASLVSSTSSSPPSGHAPVSENSPSYVQSIGTSSGEALGSLGFLLPGDIPLTAPAPLPSETTSSGAQVPPNVQSSTSILPSLGEASNSILTPASPTLIPTYTPFEIYVTAEGGNVIGSRTFTPFESSVTDAQRVIIGSQTFTPFENSITESGGNIVVFQIFTSLEAPVTAVSGNTFDSQNLLPFQSSVIDAKGNVIDLQTYAPLENSVTDERGSPIVSQTFIPSGSLPAAAAISAGSAQTDAVSNNSQTDLARDVIGPETDTALTDSPTGSVSVEGAFQTNPPFEGIFTDAGGNSIISQTFTPFQSLMTDAVGNTIVSQTFTTSENSPSTVGTNTANPQTNAQSESLPPTAVGIATSAGAIATDFTGIVSPGPSDFSSVISGSPIVASGTNAQLSPSASNPSAQSVEPSPSLSVSAPFSGASNVQSASSALNAVFFQSQGSNTASLQVGSSGTLNSVSIANASSSQDSLSASGVLGSNTVLGSASTPSGISTGEQWVGFRHKFCFLSIRSKRCSPNCLKYAEFSFYIKRSIYCFKSCGFSFE